MGTPPHWASSFNRVLDKAGNPHTTERIALLKRFTAVFGINNIAALLADRKFAGEDWFNWLQAQAIPFHQRFKRDTRIPNAWNQLKRADQLFRSLEAVWKFRISDLDC